MDWLYTAIPAAVFIGMGIFAYIKEYGNQRYKIDTIVSLVIDFKDCKDIKAICLDEGNNEYTIYFYSFFDNPKNFDEDSLRHEVCLRYVHVDSRTCKTEKQLVKFIEKNRELLSQLQRYIGHNYEFYMCSGLTVNRDMYGTKYRKLKHLEYDSIRHYTVPVINKSEGIFNLEETTGE